MILKPSEKSPLSAIRLAGLAKEAGLPDGVLNVVTGFGHEAGQALSRHNDIDAIAFTGSTYREQLLKDAGDSNMKRRLAGRRAAKAPTSVFADCPDLQQAASGHRSRHLLQPGSGVHRRNAPVAGREHRR